MPPRRFRIPAIALTLTGVLAACGSDDTSAPAAAPTDAAVTSTVDVALNEADIEFAQGMIAHHEQAVEMAEIALDPNVGAGAAVVDLATRIQAAQAPEIDQMTAWLTAAGEPVTMDMSDGHDMSDMDGMMSADEMDALAAATGTEFDTMWAEMMIEHHKGAISQSETVKANGSNPDVFALADQIVTVQQAEIAEMQQLLGA